MDYSDKDYFVEIQRGRVAEHTLIHKFGRNSNVPNGAWAIVSPTGPSGTFPASGVSVRIKAGGNAADTAAGAGAREVTVVGLNTDLVDTSETISTSGASASQYTTTNFLRLFRAFVSSAGTYMSANTGEIVIENSDDMISIAEGEGQTQHGAFSIPTGKTGYLLSVHIDADASKAADFRLFTRDDISDNTAPMAAKRLRLYWDGVLGQVTYDPKAPGLILNAESDIWIEARGSAGAVTEVSVDFEILLIDDPTGPIKQV